MPFGTNPEGELVWQRAGGLATAQKRKKVADLLCAFADGTAAEYFEKVDKLMRGEDLTKEEKEGMDRFELLFPYVAAKKTENKTDVTVKTEEMTPEQARKILNLSNSATANTTTDSAGSQHSSEA